LGRVFGLLFAAALFVALPVRAEVSNSTCRATGGEMCSMAFYAEGVGKLDDEIPVILSKPWEDRSIRILDVEISLSADRPSFWNRMMRRWPKCSAFAGNSHVPDVMKAQQGEGSTPSPFFPAGKWFAFPGRTGRDDPHIDLHVSCTPGAYFRTRMIVYYDFREKPAQ
jgi:hypothetical protein